MPKKDIQKTMKRLCHRIRIDQDKFIKKMAKFANVTEGQILRDAIDLYIESKLPVLHALKSK